MLNSRIRVTNTLGLHARAAAQLVRLANSFKSEITISRIDNGASANAKSILSVLNIAAAWSVELDVTADGEDEADAMRSVTDLFARKFGEELLENY
jgi:phosphocarrier protein HPr